MAIRLMKIIGIRIGIWFWIGIGIKIGIGMKSSNYLTFFSLTDQLCENFKTRKQMIVNPVGRRDVYNRESTCRNCNLFLAT